MLLHQSQNALRVLLVEGNEGVTELFNDVLLAKGYQVKTASTVEEALLIAREYKPRVVFTSIRFVHRSGFDFCEEIRRTPETANTFIVAISGTGISTNQLGRKACFDRYLVKPVSLDQLLESIAHVMPI